MKRNIFLADSTFFILLSKANEHLIRTFVEIYGVCVNKEKDKRDVYNEVVVMGKEKAGSWLLEELVNQKLVKTLSIKNEKEVDRILKYTSKLSKENARCVQLCRENNLILITDNWHLIRTAEIENVPFVTTFDVIKKLFVETKIDYETAVDVAKKVHHFGWYRPEILEKVMENMIKLKTNKKIKNE